MMQREGHGRKKARGMLNRMGYAAGGHVKAHSDEAEDKALIKKEVKKTALKLKDGGCADGGEVKPRADRLRRGGKTKHAKSHTTVNVVVGRNHPQPVPVPKPVPVPVPAGAGPAGPGPMPPPPGAGAPPPGMPPDGGGPMPFKKGGRVRQKAAGGGLISKLAPLALMALKDGGKADTQRDKIKGMPGGQFKRGGRTKGYPIEDGAGGARGRLEKAKAYGA